MGRVNPTRAASSAKTAPKGKSASRAPAKSTTAKTNRAAAKPKATKAQPAKAKAAPKPLHERVEKSVKSYLRTLNGETPTGLYRMVIDEVERPLLTQVLQYTGGNQSQAATMLGMTRSTLRKKLQQHGIEL